VFLPVVQLRSHSSYAVLPARFVNSAGACDSGRVAGRPRGHVWELLIAETRSFAFGAPGRCESDVPGWARCAVAVKPLRKGCSACRGLLTV